MTLAPISKFLGNAPVFNLFGPPSMPLRWLSPSLPTLAQVLQIVEQICRMKHLTASVHDTLPQFAKIWVLWDHSELIPDAVSLPPQLCTTILSVCAKFYVSSVPIACSFYDSMVSTSSPPPSFPSRWNPLGVSWSLSLGTLGTPLTLDTVSNNLFYVKYYFCLCPPAPWVPLLLPFPPSLVYTVKLLYFCKFGSIVTLLLWL